MVFECAQRSSNVIRYANTVPPSCDELGDLSRSFGRLLEEVGAYSDYLRGLAGTLSHELHTPIAVVRSFSSRSSRRRKSSRPQLVPFAE